MTDPTQPVGTVPAPATRTITLPPLLGIPVATLIVVIITLVGAVLLVVDGHLPSDYLPWSASVLGGSGLLSVGRGLDAHAKP